MDASKVQIGLLEGKANWSTWKYKLSILLRGVKGGLEVLDGKLQVPQTLAEDASKEEKTRYEKNLLDFHQADSNALLILTVNMTQETLEKVMRFSTARDVWLELHRLFEEITTLKSIPILWVDNEAAIRLTQNPEYHRRTKHIHIRHFFVRELVLDGIIQVEKVSSESQLADIMTKPLFKPRLQMLRNIMGMT